MAMPIDRKRQHYETAGRNLKRWPVTRASSAIKVVAIITEGKNMLSFENRRWIDGRLNQISFVLFLVFLLVISQKIYFTKNNKLFYTFSTTTENKCGEPHVGTVFFHLRCVQRGRQQERCRG